MTPGIWSVWIQFPEVAGVAEEVAVSSNPAFGGFSAQLGANRGSSRLVGGLGGAGAMGSVRGGVNFGDVGASVFHRCVDYHVLEGQVRLLSVLRVVVGPFCLGSKRYVVDGVAKIGGVGESVMHGGRQMSCACVRCLFSHLAFDSIPNGRRGGRRTW